MNSQFSKNLRQIALTLLLGVSMFSHAQLLQLDKRSIDVKAADLVSIPPSPEAAAFIQYGNNTVSMYTGKPDIAIPIHTVSNRKLSHPISLTYTPGIKVSQMATEVGLGWNLNAGGVVTRNVAGQPDDHLYNTTGYFAYYSEVNGGVAAIGTQMDVDEYFDLYVDYPVNENDMRTLASNEVQDYVKFRRQVLRNKIETQPDSYSFSVGGLSGTIYIDYKNESAFCLEMPDLKVEVTFATGVPNVGSYGIKPIHEWTITDKSGTKYRFSETEVTHSTDYHDIGENDAFQDMNYTSAWKLTTITSFDNKDQISFEYSPKTQYTTEQLQLGATMRRDAPNANGNITDCSEGYTNYFHNDIGYTIEKGWLSAISVNGYDEILINRPTNERLDLPGTKWISGIEVYNIDNDQVNRFNFNYDYFTGTGSPTPEFNKRLKLLSVDEFKQTNDAQTYTFTYDNTTIPARDSFAQDYWGYYNGVTGNQSMIPYNSEYTDDFTEAGNRNPSVNHIQAGTLTAIEYPTGGTTEYHYDMPLIYTGTSSTQEVFVDGWTLQGGLDPTDAVGYTTCDDEWVVAPKSMTSGIGIFEGGNYILKLNVTGTPSTGSGPPLIQFAAFYNGIGAGYCPVAASHGTLPFSQFAPLSYSTIPITLSSGLYKVMLLNSDPGLTISLQLWKIETVTGTSTKPIGALRLTKLIDKDEDDNIAKQRYFYYSDLSTKTPAEIYPSMLETSASLSGVLHRPNFFEINFTEQEQHGSLYEDCPFLNRYATNQATNTPHTITYGTVTEVEVDPASGDYNGFTVSRFHNKNEGIGTSPYIKSELLNGKLKSKHVYKYDPISETNQLLTSEHKTYEAEWLNDGVQWTGLTYRSQNSKRYQDLVIRQDSASTDLFYRFEEMVIGSFDGSPPMPTSCAAYQHINDYPDLYECADQGPMELKSIQKIGGSRYWIKDISTTTKVYDPDNSAVFKESTTTNGYSIIQHYQLVSSQMTDDLGAVVRNEYFYPIELGGVAQDSMVSSNRVGELIKTILRHDGELQMQKNTNYTEVGGTYLPSEVVLSYYDGVSSQTSTMTINSYNDENRVQELTDKSGIVHTYLWDVNSQYLVAEITGATYAEVVSALLTTLGTSSTVSEEDNWHMALVDGLPQAVVTSFVMEPLVGMTRKRDPNGNILYYDYDDRNRLSRIRQKLRGETAIHILEEYEYNYASN